MTARMRVRVGRQMMRKLLPASLGASLILGGCASSQAIRPTGASDNLRPITARFLGATGVMNITAVQFIGRRVGWFGVDEVASLGGQPMKGSSWLMRTTDGGASFVQASKAPGPILALDFLSRSGGFVLVGGSGPMTLLAASDGGTLLATISHPPGSATSPELHFTSSSTGFLVSGKTLDVTTDGGRIWTSSTMALPTPPPVSYAPAPSTPYFLTARHGFLAMRGGIYRTTDGGQSWQKVYSLPAGLTAMLGNFAAGPVTFVTSQLGYGALNILNCWAGGCPDVIVRTEDGGATWRPVSGEMQGPLPGLHAPATGPPGGINSIVGWGPDGVAAATMQGISISHSGGATWSLAAHPYLATFSVLSYAPGAGLLAAGMSYLLQLRSDGGWRTDWPAPAPTAQVDFVSPIRGYGLALEPLPLLLRSTNAGRTWQRASLPSSASEPTEISFADMQHGWLLSQVLGLPEILATSDGGLRWHEIVGFAYPSSGQLFPGGHGVVLSQPSSGQTSPTLLATSDGGGRFAGRRLPRGFPPGGTVLFSSPRVGFAIAMGETPMVWKTADGGITWHRLAVPGDLSSSGYITSAAVDAQRDVWLAAALRGLAQSERIYIRHSSGAWQAIRVPRAVAQMEFSGENSLDVISSERAFLVTPAGLFETSDGGRTWRNLTWPKPHL